MESFGNICCTTFQLEKRSQTKWRKDLAWLHQNCVCWCFRTQGWWSKQAFIISSAETHHSVPSGAITDLNVTIIRPGALQSGAKWRIDWRPHRAAVANRTSGTFSVIFERPIIETTLVFLKHVFFKWANWQCAIYWDLNQSSLGRTLLLMVLRLNTLLKLCDPDSLYTRWLDGS